MHGTEIQFVIDLIEKLEEAHFLHSMDRDTAIVHVSQKVFFQINSESGDDNFTLSFWNNERVFVTDAYFSSMEILNMYLIHIASKREPAPQWIQKQIAYFYEINKHLVPDA